MRREWLFAAAAVALTASPAFSSTFVSSTFRASKSDPLVCKRDRETILGSHMRAPRTCMLRSQWRQLEEHTRNELQQIMDGRRPFG